MTTSNGPRFKPLMILLVRRVGRSSGLPSIAPYHVVLTVKEKRAGFRGINGASP